MAYTKEYLEELKILHSKKTFGLGGKLHPRVDDLLTSGTIDSFLDFGAGKGVLSNLISEKFPTVELHSYDPVTFPNPLPDQVDMIYSSDVLEHIEPDLIESTLLDLSNRATKYQYHLIACHPAKKSLSDGRNAHLIIESPDWWRNKIQAIAGWKIIFEDTTHYLATVKKGPQIEVIKYIVIMEKNETSI